MVKRLGIVFLFFLYTNTVLLCIAFENDTSFEYSMWASGILWLNCIPITHYIISGYKREIFPYVSILGFFVTLTYSLPVFFLKPASYEIAALTEKGLVYAFWGYLIFYFFYYVFYRFIKFRRCFNVIWLPMSDGRIRLLALFFLAAYFFGKRIRFSS